MANRLYLPIHCRRRRNEIRTRSGGNHRLLAQIQQGRIVVHAVIAQHTTVAMRGVFAEAGIGHDDHLRHTLFADARHACHEAVFFPGIAAGRVSVVGDTERHHRADARIRNAFDLAGQMLFRNAHHARHRVDGFVVIDLFFNKNRQHQIV